MSFFLTPDCLEVFPEPLILVGGSGRLLAANRPAAAVLGLAGDSVPEETLRELTGYSAAELEELLHSCLTTNSPVALRLPLVPAGKPPRSLRCEGWGCPAETEPAVLIRICDGAEGTSRFGELSRLVNELDNECKAHREAEERLRAALGQLHDINDTRDHILAHVSHDLRTPLNAILGMAEFMREEPFGALGEKYAEYVQDIYTSGTTLLEVVDQVSHLTAEDVDWRERTATGALADLGECLENCRKAVEPIARMRGLEVLVPANISVPELHTDQLVLKQILVNLLASAARYTQRGGWIQISVDWCEGQSLLIQVRDSGPGIPAARLNALMANDLNCSPYIAEEGASGFGLALSRRSAKAIGGDLDIESTPEGGTVASLVLPSWLVASHATAG